MFSALIFMVDMLSVFLNLLVYIVSGAKSAQLFFTAQRFVKSHHGMLITMWSVFMATFFSR